MPGPLFYTSAIHAHWSGAQASHAGDVLAAAVRAALEWQRDAGARGVVSFDGAGFEQLAARAPRELASLRDAVARGELEVVGGTYAQPCGLLHGGESNVRQRVLGARAIRRLIGEWPRCAWESSFDFFPQAPQILAGCGFDSAALFHAWSARTPRMPLERAPLIEWEGLDGTRLLALAHTERCVQELAEELAQALEAPDEPRALLQWFDTLGLFGGARVREQLAAAAAQLGTTLESATASQLIARLRELGGPPPVRAYELDETFHGLTLGKNGDYMPRFSRSAEEQLLAAESLSALAGMFGRPYASRDVYPAWELEEAWRELCIGQHHHMHEREGEGGAAGERAYERAVALSHEVFQRTLEHLGQRVDGLEGSTLVYNPLGWTRDVQHESGVVRAVPALGYKVIDPYDDVEEPQLGRIQMELGESELILRRGAFEARIDRARGVVTQIFSRDFPQGVLSKARPLGQLEMRRNRSLERFDTVHLSSESSESAEFAEFAFLREGRGGSRVRIVYSMSMLHDALWIRFQGENLSRPDAGGNAALSSPIAAAFKPARLLRDHPYGVSETRAEHDYVRRYPSEAGAAESFTETLERPFTAQSFVDLLEDGPDGRGLLVLNDGSQGWMRDSHGVRVVLNAYDPWDGEHFDNVFDAELWLAPHGALTNTERMRLSMECNLGSPRFEANAAVLGGGDLPPTLGAVSVDSPNVLLTALYREGPDSAEREPGTFGESVRDPFVLRLVEFDGRPAEALVRLPGPIAKAAKTDLLGRVITPLVARAAPPPFGPEQLPWSLLVVPLRPYEIATVMVDLEFGRQVGEPADAVAASAWSARRGHLAATRSKS